MTQSTKQKVLELVEQLPSDASIDDVMERLYFLAKVERGLEQLAIGQTIPHDEVKRRYQK